MRYQRVTSLFVMVATFQFACASPRVDGIAAMVRSANTPADHREIAAYYHTQAATARTNVADHERLADLYQSRRYRDVAFYARQKEHCERLVVSLERVAAQFELLAIEHERLANE